MQSVQNMNSMKFANQKLSYNFDCLHFLVEFHLMIASPSEKHKKGAKSSCGPKLEALTVLITKNQLPHTS
jgi:hypothetical protein